MEKLNFKQVGHNVRDYFFKNRQEIEKAYAEYSRTRKPDNRLSIVNFAKEMFKVQVAMGGWTPRRGPKPDTEGTRIVQL